MILMAGVGNHYSLDKCDNFMYVIKIFNSRSEYKNGFYVDF